MVVVFVCAVGACGGGGHSAGEGAQGVGTTPDVFRTACHVPTSAAEAPQSLLDTGCFAANGNAAAPLYGYTVNGVLWADAAEKQRWLLVPQGKQASFDQNHVLVLPPGGGVFKVFLRGATRLETRLVFRDANDTYQAVTYAWNDAMTDATLVPAAGQERKFADGSVWEYYSRSNCMYCHNAAAGTLLGPRIPQLNRAMMEVTAPAANQLDDMVAKGLLTGWDKSVAAWPEPAGPAPLAQRARTYLATNCSFCHLPGGASGTQVDWRFDTPLADTQACAQAPNRGSSTVANAQILCPGAPERSLVSYRMHSADPRWKMPPVGHDVVDPNGTALIDAWITSLKGCTE